MKTLKAKFILFSLLAFAATSFLTSCEQPHLVDFETPTEEEGVEFRDGRIRHIDGTGSNGALPLPLGDEVIFNTLLDAVSGNFVVGAPGKFLVELSANDTGTSVYDAVMDAESVTIAGNVSISAIQASEIFCVPGLPCIQNAYTFLPTKIEFTAPPSELNVGGVDSCFQLRPGYWVCMM